MATWYLYSDDGKHLGPVAAEYVARALKSGAVTPDRWVTESDRAAWRPVREVPEICALLTVPPTSKPRDREATMIATTDAFPSLSPSVAPPSTQREAPSSSDPLVASERTIIAPAAFEAEMAQVSAELPSQPALPPDTSASLPVTPRAPPHLTNPYAAFDEDVTLRAKSSPFEGSAATTAQTPPPEGADAFGATMRSPDSPAGVAPRPIPAVESAHPPVPRAGPQRTSVPSPGMPAAAPAPATATPSHGRRGPGPSSRGKSSGGPVVVFFLGGLVLGAVVVVSALVWAFRGGLFLR